MSSFHALCVYVTVSDLKSITVIKGPLSPGTVVSSIHAMCKPKQKQFFISERDMSRPSVFVLIGTCELLNSTPITSAANPACSGVNSAFMLPCVRVRQGEEAYFMKMVCHPITHYRPDYTLEGGSST